MENRLYLGIYKYINNSYIFYITIVIKNEAINLKENNKGKGFEGRKEKEEII